MTVSPETRAKLSAAGRRAWEGTTPEERRERMAWVRSWPRRKVPPMEQAVARALEELGVEHLAQHRVGPYTVDFLLDEGLVLECDSTYWHSLPGRPDRDRKRDAYLRKQGYYVIRLRDTDLRGSVVEAVQSALARALGMEENHGWW